MAATARALFLSLKPRPPPPPTVASRHIFLRPLLPATTKRRSSSPSVLSCLVSGVDGGGVADDFVSIRKSDFDRGFSVIANMLKRIEPLDTSVISKGVSASARDSMKQTISTMLGLLPSDQFSVTIRVSRRPLDRLLVSSIITGYTLWNAEYRVSLMRNFEISSENTEASVSSQGCEVSDVECEERESLDGVDGCCKDVMERRIPENLGELSPEALSYIQELKLELATIEEELNAQKQENMHMEYNREESNDLLKYLRSLEPNMVTELSQPSSSEVEEIIHQLAQNILQKFFKDDTTSGFLENPAIGRTVNSSDGDDEFCDSIGTSRDYLAKLLFCLVSCIGVKHGVVYAIGSSLERLGEQIASELCCWVVVKRREESRRRMYILLPRQLFVKTVFMVTDQYDLLCYDQSERWGPANGWFRLPSLGYRRKERRKPAAPPGLNLAGLANFLVKGAEDLKSDLRTICFTPVLKPRRPTVLIYANSTSVYKELHLCRKDLRGTSPP
ncbi:hypothetical protein HHK36_024857 [Tetracentron sinense]|uniref:Uncharacterized protein n=1 Tax=Tetracentron sinense TaxID=13715 RepID=A0A835D739_TETSI|nr:hypothetical protein HHK36_024857 [Tetracentron sinense]